MPFQILDSKVFLDAISSGLAIDDNSLNKY